MDVGDRILPLYNARERQGQDLSFTSLVQHRNSLGLRFSKIYDQRLESSAWGTPVCNGISAAAVVRDLCTLLLLTLEFWLNFKFEWVLKLVFLWAIWKGNHKSVVFNGTTLWGVRRCKFISSYPFLVSVSRSNYLYYMTFHVAWCVSDIYLLRQVLQRKKHMDGIRLSGWSLRYWDGADSFRCVKWYPQMCSRNIRRLTFANFASIETQATALWCNQSGRSELVWLERWR